MIAHIGIGILCELNAGEVEEKRKLAQVESEEECKHPAVPSFLEYVPNRLV